MLWPRTSSPDRRCSPRDVAQHGVRRGDGIRGCARPDRDRFPAGYSVRGHTRTHPPPIDAHRVGPQSSRPARPYEEPASCPARHLLALVRQSALPGQLSTTAGSGMTRRKRSSARRGVEPARARLPRQRAGQRSAAPRPCGAQVAWHWPGTGTDTGTGAYAVSVRALLASPSGADALCRRFGGGGRARAAGIDALPTADVERFLAAFASTRRGGQAPMRSGGGNDGGGSSQHIHR